MLAMTPRIAPRSFTLLAAGTLALLLPSTARADRPQSQPASQPVSRPATRPTTRPANPEAHQRAQALIDQAMAQYHAAGTYQDKLEARIEFVATDKDGKDVGQTDEYSTSLVYAAPKRVALVADNYSIYCDGKQLWLYAGALDQYTENPAPDHLDYARLGEEVMVDDPPHPVLFVLTQPDKKFAELFPMVREFTAVAREERDGRPGTRVSGIFDAEDTPFGFGPELVPFSVWFDEKTGLLGELRFELTAAVRKAMGLAGDKRENEEPEEEFPGRPKHVERAQATLRFNDAKIDADIATDRFVFKPEKGTEKVAEFNWEALMQMPDPQDLIGQPAPAFSGDSLDGKPLSLESLRGRVVVLDFWAIWCVPCVKAMPQIQKIAERFADKQVTVIGINQDARGTEKKVKKFIEDKKITFRQFPDAGGKLGRSYKVAAIPCTFLIDGKGTVQAVHRGLDPQRPEELGKQLTEQIEKLLKGENLFDPEKLAQEKKNQPKNPAKRPAQEPAEPRK